MNENNQVLGKANRPIELEEVLDYLDTGDPVYPGRRATALAAIQSHTAREVAKARRDMERDQVRFMVALLRSVGGRIEISPRAYIEAEPTDKVEAWTDPATGNRAFRLAQLTKEIKE